MNENGANTDCGEDGAPVRDAVHRSSLPWISSVHASKQQIAYVPDQGDASVVAMQNAPKSLIHAKTE